MKRVMAFFTIIVIFGVSAVLYIASREGKLQDENNNNKLLVTASFYPLAEFAKRVGGEKVDVVNVTPAGTEAHEYEPTPQDIIAVQKAKIFLYQGSGFDPWAEKAAADLSPGKTTVIKMTEKFNLRTLEENNQKTQDPHIWLDPVLAQRQVEIIRDELIAVDPANGDYYKSNTDAFISDLRRLDEFIRKSLANCEIKDFIVSHEAFGYFADRYGLNGISISGIDPGEEPDAKRLGELAGIAREKNIAYIFFETLVSPKLAETVAREAGIKTEVLNPVEGLNSEEVKTGNNYLSVMENNSLNLRKALRCK